MNARPGGSAPDKVSFTGRFDGVPGVVVIWNRPGCPTVNGVVGVPIGVALLVMVGGANTVSTKFNVVDGGTPLPRLRTSGKTPVCVGVPLSTYALLPGS